MNPAQRSLRWGKGSGMVRKGMLALTILVLMSRMALAGEECIGEHFTAQVNGVSIYYEVAGEGKPVLLLHGYAGNHRLLGTEIRQLVEAGYQVIAPDSRGQGENAPLDEYHYDDMAEDMRQLIALLGLERPAVYGWSDGGIVALTLELAAPGTFSIMAISGANLNPGGIHFNVDDIDSLERSEIDPLDWMVMTEPDILPESLASIDIPVLVTAGSEDFVMREHTELIAQSLPDSTMIILEGESHESYIGDSEIMGNLLIDFLREHGY